MKKIIFLFTILTTLLSYSQVGIGTTTPSNAAMLDINSGTTGNYGGLMPPRVPDTAAQISINPTVADAGLMVFVESTGCLDLWNGTSWDNINCGGGSRNLWINEFHYANTGTDTGEFIEIAGIAGIDLSDYYIIRYNDIASSYSTVFGLSNIIDDESMGYGAVSFFLDPMRNATNGIALVGPNGLIQFISYEGTITGTGAPINGVVSEDILVSEPNNSPVGFSLQLTGTGNTYTDFTWTAPSAESPGTLNTGQVIN